MLSDSIETALKRLHPRIPEDRKWAVVLPINTCRHQPDALPTSSSTVQEEVELFIMKDGDEWKVDDAQLEALLSLASFSAWVTTQIKKNRTAKEQKTSSSAVKSFEHRTKRPTVKDHQSIGWLREKAPESPCYEKIIGKSSPRLVSDLSWWIGDVEQGFRKVKIVNEINSSSIFIPSQGSSSSDRETNYDEVIDSLTLGFYANNESAPESNIFLFSKCTERQAFILHLFSAFIWTITECVSAPDFHPTIVIRHRAATTASSTSPTSFIEWHSSENDPSCLITGGCHQLKSDKMENLVQELCMLGLGTSEDVYRVLIPPLSQFDKLTNEAIADWCHQSLIAREDYMYSAMTFSGYQSLVAAIQHREVKDRFACRTAAIILGFLFRIHDDFKALESMGLQSTKDQLNETLRELLGSKNKAFRKSIESLMPILRRQQKTNKINRMWLTFGFDDSRLQIPPATDAVGENDFTFPDSTDVFGWTKENWEVFEGSTFVKEARYYKTLDLAGQSVLHNVIDVADEYYTTNDQPFLGILEGFAVYRLFKDSELLTAKGDKQTPLHRAAKFGLTDMVSELLFEGADPNAADFFERTALCFAAHNGNSSVIDLLCKKMNDGLDQLDRNRRNALHHAILNHQEAAALDLIRRKINVNELDFWMKTPIWYAATRGMETVVKALLETDGIQVQRLGFSDKGRELVTAKKEAKLQGHTKIVEMIEEWKRRHENPSKMESEDEQDKGKSSSRSGSTAVELKDMEEEEEAAE